MFNVSGSNELIIITRAELAEKVKAAYEKGISEAKAEKSKSYAKAEVKSPEGKKVKQRNAIVEEAKKEEAEDERDAEKPE